MNNTFGDAILQNVCTFGREQCTLASQKGTSRQFDNPRLRTHVNYFSKVLVYVFFLPPSLFSFELASFLVPPERDISNIPAKRVNGTDDKRRFLSSTNRAFFLLL